MVVGGPGGDSCKQWEFPSSKKRVMSGPRITIGLPLYNGERHVRQALESICSQTMEAWELVVCDDASTDGGVGVVESIHDPRIRLIRNERRLGLGGNWNRCVKEASAPLVTLFHQDDVMHPDHLASKVRMMEGALQIVFAFSNADCIDDEGRVLDYSPFTVDWSAGEVSGREFLMRYLPAAVNWVCCPGVVTRREAVLACGGYDASLPFTLDMDMWLKLAVSGSVGFASGVGVSHRRHEAQATQQFPLRRGLIEEHRVKRSFLNAAPANLELGSELAGIIDYQYADRLVRAVYHRRLNRAEGVAAITYALKICPRIRQETRMLALLWRLMRGKGSGCWVA